MNNLHELTKQLDVLTWNARSVLNALIRSAMSAGSSKGFTVTRADERIVLDKEDIYRIYHFYETWAAAGYPNDAETFNALLDAENACYGDGTPVTDALVKHAKIVWMDSTNSQMTDHGWLERIYTYSNPKWLTNTAPIPLNIRTPIYDENLSTKTYDSYETYLFPSAYYAMDTLGFLGDNSDHTAGGDNWIFDVADTFHVVADRYLFGTQNDNVVTVMSSLYNPYTQKFAFAGGTDSFAFDRNSFSYGRQNLVNGENSAVLGGSRNAVIKDDSAVLGGESNMVASDRSAIGAGYGNMIGGGDDGFAANMANSIGGYSYYFTRHKTVSRTETECPDELPYNGCTYQLVKDSGTAPGDTQLAPNQFFVSTDTVVESCIKPKCLISYGKNTGLYSPFDFKVGDYVRLFDIFVVNQGTKKACKPVMARVVSIQKLTSNGVADVDENLPDLGYIVTVSVNVNDAFHDLGSDSISSGYVCRLTAEDYPRVLDDGTVFERYTQPTRYSSAFGYDNIAAGDAQMVVGSSNVELLRPRFIVGSGTSYIGSAERMRSNSFVSAPNYTYSKVSSYIVSGVSTVTTAYIHGDDSYEQSRTTDEDYLVNQVEKYRGFYAYHIPLTGEDEGRAVLRVYDKLSTLSIGWNGLRLYQPFLEGRDNQARTVWNELYCRDGAISVHSGSFLDAGEQNKGNNWMDFYNNEVRVSTTPGSDHTVTIWAKDRTGLYGHDLTLQADDITGYISMKAFALRISADTRGALTAQPTAHNVEPFTQLGSAVNVVKDTGHVFTTKTGSGIQANDIDLSHVMQNSMFDGFHVFTSSHQMVIDATTGIGTYDVAQLLLPGLVSPSCTRALRGQPTMPRPVVIANTVTADALDNGTANRNNGYIYEELAYRSDIKSMSTQILNNVVNPAYTNLPGNSHLDMNPVVPNRNYAGVVDTFLLSLTSLPNGSYHYGATEQAVTSANLYPHRLIRASSMTGAAGTINTLGDITGNPGYFLDGVAINPGFRMEHHNVYGYTDGVTYLAFGPRGLRTTDISSSYTMNVAGNAVARTLYTSKFSAGTTDAYVSDLCDVWAISLNDGEAEWKLLLKDFIVVCSGGRLSIEFIVNGSVLDGGYCMPTKQDNATNNCVVADPNGSAITFDTNSQVLTIPLDPAIANLLQPVYNSSTQVTAQLHGRAYYTGSGNVSVTGQFSQSAACMKYDPNHDVSAQTLYTFYGPYVTINMAGWDSVNNLGSNDFYVCVEGAVYNAV